MPEPTTTLTAIIGAVASLVSAVGSVAVDRRQRRRHDAETRREDDRLALDARDGLLDRLEREIARLDSALDDSRQDNAECARLHRECLAEAGRMQARIAHLEERLDAVEQRSGDSTPVPTERA